MALVSSTPCTSSTSVVGVREIPNRRTSSRCCSVHLQMGDPWVPAGHVSEHHSRRTTRGAKRRRELQQRGGRPKTVNQRRAGKYAGHCGCGSSSTSGRRWVPLESTVTHGPPEPKADGEDNRAPAAPTHRSSCQPPAKGGSNSTTCPGCTNTSACARVPAGFVDTNTEQTATTPAVAFPTPGRATHRAAGPQEWSPAQRRRRRSHGCGCTRSRPIALPGTLVGTQPESWSMSDILAHLARDPRALEAEMSTLLLLTNALRPSAEVLPALALLPHQVRILPAEGGAYSRLRLRRRPAWTRPPGPRPHSGSVSTDSHDWHRRACAVDPR